MGQDFQRGGHRGVQPRAVVGPGAEVPPQQRVRKATDVVRL